MMVPSNDEEEQAAEARRQERLRRQQEEEEEEQRLAQEEEELEAQRRKEEREARRRQEEEMYKQMEAEETAEQERRSQEATLERMNSVEGRIEQIHHIVAQDKPPAEILTHLLKDEKYRSVIMDVMSHPHHDNETSNPLMDFLYKPESIVHMLNILLDDSHNDNATEEELRISGTVMNCICEILESRMTKVAFPLFHMVQSSIDNSKPLVFNLFKFFIEREKHTQLPPHNLAFVVRLLLFILATNSADLTGFINNNSDAVLPFLMKHIASERVLSLLWKFIDASIRRGRSDWCDDVIEGISKKLQECDAVVTSNSDDVIIHYTEEMENIMSLVKDLLHQHPLSGTASQILSQDFAKVMLKATFSPKLLLDSQKSSCAHKDTLTKLAMSLLDLISSMLDQSKSDLELEHNDLPELLIVLLRKNDDHYILNLIQNVWETSSSHVYKLVCLQFIQKLIATNFTEVDDVIMSSNIMSKVFGLFFAHTTNNILHSVVVDIVRCIGDRHYLNPDFARHMLQEGGLADSIASTFENDPRHSVTYSAHLLSICSILQSKLSREELEKYYPEWEDVVTPRLAVYKKQTAKVEVQLQSPQMASTAFSLFSQLEEKGPSSSNEEPSNKSINHNNNNNNNNNTNNNNNNVELRGFASLFGAPAKEQPTQETPTVQQTQPARTTQPTQQQQQQKQPEKPTQLQLEPTTPEKPTQPEKPVQQASAQQPVKPTTTQSTTTQPTTDSTKHTDCDTCGKSATYVCVACDEYFCEECNETQHQSVKRRLHTRTQIVSVPKCDNCENHVLASVHCRECDENHCTACDSEQHRSIKKKTHVRVPIRPIMTYLGENGENPKTLVQQSSQPQISLAQKVLPKTSSQPTLSTQQPTKPTTQQTTPTKPLTQTPTTTPTTTPTKQLTPTKSTTQTPPKSTPSPTSNQNQTWSFYGTCIVCNRNIDVPFQSLKVKDKVFHKKCFACETCKKSITSNYSEKNGKFFCPNCFKNSATCVGCSNPIGNSILNALEGTWHQQCFVCPICSKSMAGENFLPHQGRPYCRVHHPNFQAEQKDFGTCTGCKIKIDAAGLGVTIDGQAWHNKCFVCNRCKKSTASAYKMEGELAYCPACYSMQFAPPCTACKLPVKFGLITYAATSYHDSCFRCTSCSMVLPNSQSARELMGKLLCGSCFHKNSEPRPQVPRQTSSPNLVSLSPKTKNPITTSPKGPSATPSAASPNPTTGPNPNLTLSPGMTVTFSQSPICKTCALPITSEFFVCKQDAFYHGYCFGDKFDLNNEK